MSTTRWETVLAVDFDKWACACYRANFPGVRVECGPVADYIDTLPYADVLLGGPPCQPHSLAGKRKASADARDCGPDFAAAVYRVKPRQFLMENVDALLSSEDGRYFQRLYESLYDAGYLVAYRVQDAVNFGVPQFRRRLWVWGIRRDLYAGGMRHSWPVATHAWPPPVSSPLFGEPLLPGVTVRQALSICGVIRRDRGAGMLERGGARRDFGVDEPCQTLTADNTGGAGCRLSVLLQSHADPAQTIDRPSPTLRSGGRGHDGCCLRLQYDHGVAVLDEPCPTIKAGGNKDFTGKQGGGCPPMLSLDCCLAIPRTLDKPCPTISAGSSHTGGPEPVNNRIREGFKRRLTPVECARLQSVPDSFVWLDRITKTGMYRVVGNGWACAHARKFSEAFSRVDPESKTVISLFCGGGLGDVGWHGHSWAYDRQEVAA